MSVLSNSSPEYVNVGLSQTSFDEIRKLLMLAHSSGFIRFWANYIKLSAIEARDFSHLHSMDEFVNGFENKTSLATPALSYSGFQIEIDSWRDEENRI